MWFPSLALETFGIAFYMYYTYMYISFSVHSRSISDALKGSNDARSSLGSRDVSLVSTEKNNSLPRRSSIHTYTEIDTISQSESKVSHSSQADSGASGNGSVSVSKAIPPPPNMRAGSSAMPHFYYVLEKMGNDEDEKGKEENKLKGPWELGYMREGKQTPRSCSREGSTKDRAGSLEREVGEGTGTKNESSEGGGIMRSGSYPSKDRGGGGGGGNLNRVVISRDGSAKSSKSHRGSVKLIDGSVKAGEGSREGSVKSRGSRDGSFKKEVWVPTREQQKYVAENERKDEKRVPLPHRDYDVLEPGESYSHDKKSDFIGRDSKEGGATKVLFDDPKYAAMTVGELPRLVIQRHHSLDLITPQDTPTHAASALDRGKAASSKSLEGSGLVQRSESIYRTRDTTPIDNLSTTPSRLSVPFDAII